VRLSAESGMVLSFLPSRVGFFISRGSQQMGEIYAADKVLMVRNDNLDITFFWKKGAANVFI
jgi:hypothetical protein